ncbi:unnamed protein product [Calypogeia fissa]
MASYAYSTSEANIELEEQQSILRSGPANEVFEEWRSARDYSRHESGLRHRLPKTRNTDSDVASDGHGEEKCLLGDRIDIATSSQSSSKTHHHSFSKSIEKYLSACCRFSVRFKLRRPKKSKKLVTPPQNMKMDLQEGDHGVNVPCLGQGWRGLRKRLGDMIKIEEEIFTSVPRSVLYYA